MYVKPLIIVQFLLIFLFSGCAAGLNSNPDITGFHKCRPVNENCLGNKEKFFAQPQMRALESWRGRHVNELLSEWGFPDQIDDETDGKPGKRYVWIDEYTVDRETRLHYRWWWYDWSYYNEPYERYRCKTYMVIGADGIITPAWVDKFVACTQFFNPRPSAPTSDVVNPTTPKS
jgi:hypothetical protein